MGSALREIANEIEATGNGHAAFKSWARTIRHIADPRSAHEEIEEISNELHLMKLHTLARKLERVYAESRNASEQRRD